MKTKGASRRPPKQGDSRSPRLRRSKCNGVAGRAESEIKVTGGNLGILHVQPHTAGSPPLRFCRPWRQRCFQFRICRQPKIEIVDRQLARWPHADNHPPAATQRRRCDSGGTGQTVHSHRRGRCTYRAIAWRARRRRLPSGQLKLDAIPGCQITRGAGQRGARFAVDSESR